MEFREVFQKDILTNKALKDSTDSLSGKKSLNVSKRNIKQCVGSRPWKGRIISKVLNTLKIKALNYKNRLTITYEVIIELCMYTSQTS